MTGSDLIVNTLIESGVTVCFGYPGGAAMPLYDALYRKRSQIRHVRTAHEQGASHAADGYARASGKLGVCIATSGPGATNLVTGIATAFSDSSHVLFITANVNSSEIGTDSFQEADIFGITTPVCKYNWIVRDPYSLYPTLKKAIKLSTEGRPGPVLLDVPHDILSFEFPKGYVPKDSSDESESRTPVIPDVNDETIAEIAALIKKAKKPVIIAGGGVGISGAYSELKELSRKANIHVATTLMACGVLPSDDSLNLGMVGAYGNPLAIKYVSEADLVIAVGMRFSNRTHGALSAANAIIHIDSDAAELDKNVKATLPVNGDAKTVLKRVIKALDNDDSSFEEKSNSKIQAKLSEEVKTVPPEIIPSQLGTYMFSAEGDRLVKDAFSLIKKKLGDVFVVTDVGIHQMATARLYPFEKPGRLITSGGFGTMGFGLGADIGVSVASSEEPFGIGSVLVSGDGSFRMSLQELSSVKENKIKTLIVIINNKSLGMVRNIQKKAFGRRYIATEASYKIPDFKMIARAYGLYGFVARNIGDFERALDEYILGNKTAVIDLRI